MVRESLLLALVVLPGCSLILDFSDKAGVHDASLDGPYTLDECSYKEPNDSLDTAAVIDPATDMGPAAICKVASGEDDDYYKFTVPDMTAKVTITLNNATGGGDLDLKLYDATGDVIGQSRSFGPGETLVCPAISPSCPTLAAGDYVFEVLPGSPVNLNNYTFSVAFN
ncbi:MAG TPA: PPC domain-containing protein [Kofleriaceae bacterium]|nr:PPC domain-containing protein [Kofleriaceae bacterium]